MHMAHLVTTAMLAIRRGGAPASPEAVFPDWQPHDRFGIVIDEPFGGLGAALLIQLATTLFYDARPSRRAERKVYPEIYALHRGRGFGAHAPFDFWPARREAILDGDHRVLLDAVNDRGITRLALPDRPPRDIEHRPKEEDAALDRIVSAVVYSAGGRVDAPDFTISGTDLRTEHNPGRVLKLAGEPQPKPTGSGSPLLKESDTSYHDWIELRRGDTTPADRERAIARRRALLDEAGLATESYRFIGVAEALKRL
ncbi:hypothetical protein [Labrys monachus]|uniref:Uncharacterized protein n=1 Tax=Labrys monachus TaxID=217067 RepID=A0ABU0FAY6_9HYPH|nr:hypothetical protein [Labrys monachus]MDQ0391782.1 hypothetical protein [Labrys monachus]